MRARAEEAGMFLIGGVWRQVIRTGEDTYLIDGVRGKVTGEQIEILKEKYAFRRHSQPSHLKLLALVGSLVILLIGFGLGLAFLPGHLQHTGVLPPGITKDERTLKAVRLALERAKDEGIVSEYTCDYSDNGGFDMDVSYTSAKGWSASVQGYQFSRSEFADVLRRTGDYESAIHHYMVNNCGQPTAEVAYPLAVPHYFGVGKGGAWQQFVQRMNESVGDGPYPRDSVSRVVTVGDTNDTPVCIVSGLNDDFIYLPKSRKVLNQKQYTLQFSSAAGAVGELFPGSYTSGVPSIVTPNDPGYHEDAGGSNEPEARRLQLHFSVQMEGRSEGSLLVVDAFDPFITSPASVIRSSPSMDLLRKHYLAGAAALGKDTDPEQIRYRAELEAPWPQPASRTRKYGTVEEAIEYLKAADKKATAGKRYTGTDMTGISDDADPIVEVMGYEADRPELGYFIIVSFGEGEFYTRAYGDGTASQGRRLHGIAEVRQVINATGCTKFQKRTFGRTVESSKWGRRDIPSKTYPWHRTIGSIEEEYNEDNYH